MRLQLHASEKFCAGCLPIDVKSMNKAKAEVLSRRYLFALGGHNYYTFSKRTSRSTIISCGLTSFGIF